ncbi:MAG: NAD-dependent malic enzyme [Geothrix sp.]|uniref:NAD-dependent malic enzyme n=1 Tax=Geothrix sp. TaxID=1962974 RepID=UPI0017E08D7A|nr:NAD-dependent malic enzyme [Geothrix sp.]NWJ40177.1 NAD-dependent malic enzyme [Geothrix sp.]WIL21815.1 MAG: NAD-dependent malic enzyme [Geothrix sp.]
MKNFVLKIDPLTGEDYYEVYLRGRQLLNNPHLNKASAFTKEERLSLGLDGMLRPGIATLESQLDRTYEAFLRKPDDMERYIYLSGLLDRNEVLFYRLLQDHLDEMVPIIYTPTVGLACMQLSHIQRRFRGIYITPENIANIDQIFHGLSQPQVNLIVVTDGERILGLGDLGSDGMGIPVGKVSLYVAAGGVHPGVTLPITLDVGTNNPRLLEDPLYLGIRKPRLRGVEYEELVEKFVLGVKRNFPGALLQWEDFAKQTAFKNLDRYRERILSFNDDIQGTGSTALAALMTAMRIKKSRFQDERYVIVGMGQAGTGIALNILAMLKEEGLSAEEARKRIFAVDMQGLLLEGDPLLEDPQEPLAQRRAWVEGWRLDDPSRIGLGDVIRNAHPTVLIGVTAQPGLFSEAILAETAKHSERPIVLALSNPTHKCECTPEAVWKATDGKGLVATGSPFEPMDWKGHTLQASQCNNMYIFPGVGLGALVCKATRVTDGMFLAASRAISEFVTPEQEAMGLLLPEMKDIRKVSASVAKAVGIEARNAGLGRLLDDDQIGAVVTKAQWVPAYPAYRPGALRYED